METQPPEDRKEGLGYVMLGIGLTLLLHLLQIPLSFVGIAMMEVPPVLFIGVSQLIYVVPAILIARSRQQPGLAKGLIIGAALTFLLNAACFGLFMYAFSGW